MDSSKCKESVAKLHNIDNQRLLERERQLKLRLQRQPDLPQSQNLICVDQNKLAIGGIFVALLIIILGILTACKIKHTRNPNPNPNQQIFQRRIIHNDVEADGVETDG
jgi:hypothetical protein